MQIINLIKDQRAPCEPELLKENSKNLSGLCGKKTLT